MLTLKGKITQSGDSAPGVVLFNEEIVQFSDCEYLQKGQYKAVCNKAILNSDMPPKWFLADNIGSKYVISQVNQTDVIIQCYDQDGNEADGILNGNEFEVNTK
jgi:hypothetical protein